MFDGPINEYVFNSMQSEGTSRAILVMNLPTKAYSGHVWIPWPNVARLPDDQMTAYGRWVMEELDAIYKRGKLMGKVALQREIKKALAIS